MTVNERAELFNKTQVELVDEIIQLHEQLETARTALDRIRLHNDSYVSHRIATEALAQIGAGRFDRKCPHCDFVTEYPLMFENHVKYGHGAGQKGGE